jgi:hypothetical protein
LKSGKTLLPRLRGSRWHCEKLFQWECWALR